MQGKAGGRALRRCSVRCGRVREAAYCLSGREHEPHGSRGESSPAAAAMLAQRPNDARVRGARPARKTFVAPKACKAPHPLQPIVRPRGAPAGWGTRPPTQARGRACLCLPVQLVAGFGESSSVLARERRPGESAPRSVVLDHPCGMPVGRQPCPCCTVTVAGTHMAPNSRLRVATTSPKTSRMLPLLKRIWLIPCMFENSSVPSSRRAIARVKPSFPWKRPSS